MHRRLLASAFLFAAGPIVNGQGLGLSLNPGDTFTYGFDTLPFIAHFSEPESSFANSFATPTSWLSIQPGDLLRMDMFENSTSEAPICSVFLGLTASGITENTICVVDGAWQDLQGVIRLTGISGSVPVQSLTFNVIQATVDGGHDNYSLTVVPEPTPLHLCGVGVLILLSKSYFTRRTKRRAG